MLKAAGDRFTVQVLRHQDEAADSLAMPPPKDPPKTRAEKEATKVRFLNMKLAELIVSLGQRLKSQAKLGFYS